jgi:tRNA/tmRNA/rRNA uracil-C5-methylase (TrmA/RlmC/RlmD family)
VSEGVPAEAGEKVELHVGAPVHGGHCLARLDGRVVFVRHAIPGERVLARLTETSRKGYWRADAVEILEPSPDRVPSVWPEAGPGGVGGGELAHVALPAQRRWKAAVVEDALKRVGGLERTVEVSPVPGDDERNGLGWRTRVELTADARGRAGMFRYRSHDIVPLTDMPLAVPAIRELGLHSRRWPPGARIDAIAPSGARIDAATPTGDRPLVLVDGEPLRGGRRSVRERVVVAGREHEYRVSGTGFWQVHVGAPQLLAEAVLAAAELTPGAHVLELYSGAGLLTLPLAAAVGPSGRVDAVEGDPGAARDARRNAHGLGQVVLRTGDVGSVVLHTGDVGSVVLHAGDVGALLARDEQLRPGEPADVVVLDPPRSGAGARVVTAICARRPARIVYVACDPAALARDLRVAREHGYELTELHAFDLFPHTHHVECVAVLAAA